MIRFWIVTIVSLLAISGAIAQPLDGQGVVRLDNALDALVSTDAKIELVKGGFGFTEGPVWVQQGQSGYLLFTDIAGNVVWDSRRTAGRLFICITQAIPDRICGGGVRSTTMGGTAMIPDSRSSS